METARCSGEPSKVPCATSVPRGAEGRSRTFKSADKFPLGDPRTESVEFKFALADKAVIGPCTEPDPFKVPASTGDSVLRSDNVRSQRPSMA